MSKAFSLYRLQPGPAVVAVRLALGDDGLVTLSPGDDWVGAGMALVGHGVGSIRQFRNVTPDEGEAYIQAIQGMLSTSSVWALVADDESAEFLSRLPRVRLSRCPLTQAEVVHSIDTSGLASPWWRYSDAIRPAESLPPTYCALTGAVHLAPELEKTTFRVVPGPEPPFVVSAMLAQRGVVAVLSTVPVGAHTAYPIFYFADPMPPGPRFNTWGRDGYESDVDGERGWASVPEDPRALDFKLKPWIRAGKLYWIAPGDETLTLHKTVDDCPYLDLPGRREFVRIEDGKIL